MELIKIDKFRQNNQKLYKDVLSVVGSIYSMNASRAIGYLFNPCKDDKIVSGMYCDFKDEIIVDKWTYYLEYKTKTFYQIT